MWSWDISKLEGRRKWSQFYLYVIVDALSRYVVARTGQYREPAAIAGELIAQACEQQQITREEVTPSTPIAGSR